MIEYKSKLHAALLIMFGPLGLLYVSVPAALFWGGLEWFLINRAHEVTSEFNASIMIIVTIPSMILNAIHLVEKYNEEVKTRNRVIDKIMSL